MCLHPCHTLYRESVCNEDRASAPSSLAWAMACARVRCGRHRTRDCDWPTGTGTARVRRPQSSVIAIVSLSYKRKSWKHSCDATAESPMLHSHAFPFAHSEYLGGWGAPVRA